MPWLYPYTDWIDCLNIEPVVVIWGRPTENSWRTERIYYNKIRPQEHSATGTEQTLVVPHDVGDMERTRNAGSNFDLQVWPWPLAKMTESFLLHIVSSNLTIQPSFMKNL